MTKEKIRSHALWALLGDPHARVPLTMEESVRRVEQAIRTAISEATAAEWERIAQKGHPKPCTLGSLCPYCEIERLQAVAEKAEQERDAAREMIRGIEWPIIGTKGDQCVACGGVYDHRTQTVLPPRCCTPRHPSRDTLPSMRRNRQVQQSRRAFSRLRRLQWHRSNQRRSSRDTSHEGDAMSGTGQTR